VHHLTNFETHPLRMTTKNWIFGSF
jgi:hypothetical protein